MITPTNMTLIKVIGLRDKYNESISDIQKDEKHMLSKVEKKIMLSADKQIVKELDEIINSEVGA